MVTNEEISQALDTLLGESNPNIFTSINGVIQQLESKLGFDLTNKLDFIRYQIHQFLLIRSQQQHHHHTQLLLQQQQQQQQQQRLQQIPNPRDNLALHYQTPNFVTNASPAFAAPFQFQNYNRHVSSQKLEGVAAMTTQSVAAAPEPSQESVPTKPKRKGGPGGLNKLCGVSPELQVIVGEPALPRTEIVKQLWAYIRKHSLQDPRNKRKIICNDELRVVFETDCTDMFKMNKLLAKHIYALEPSKTIAKKLKVEKPDPEKRSSKTGPSVIISEALASFFGTVGQEMPQSEVIRRVWEHIKLNHLEDPVNSLVILCDAKLQELFGCESVPALGIPEMLARNHLYRSNGN